MSGFSKPLNSIIESEDLRMRWMAFMTTSTAVFLFLCLIWPLSVSGFRSSALIQVNDDQSVDQLQLELTQAVLDETNDDALAVYVDLIESSGNLRSKQIEYRDYQTMRESIRLGQWDGPDGKHFQISYEGNGGADERQFVELLASRVATRLDSVQGTVAVNSRIERFNQAQWIIDQMEQDLDFVKSAIHKMSSGSQDQLTLETEDEAGRFQFASSKRVVAPSFDEMETSIDSIDIESLRSVIEGLKTDSTTPRSVGGTQDGSTQPRATGPESIETLPINGVPSVPWLILIGSFSALVGSTVAWNFQPFESRGFSDFESLEKKLEVPVVATIGLVTESDDGTPGAKNVMSFSNRVVRLGGLFLFGLFVVVAGFVLISPEVRQAFMENPFYGFAKIVRMFAGY